MSSGTTKYIGVAVAASGMFGIMAGVELEKGAKPDVYLLRNDRNIPIAIGKAENHFPDKLYFLDSANVKKFSNLEQNLNAIKDFGSGKNGNEVEKILNAELQNYVDSVDAVKTR